MDAPTEKAEASLFLTDYFMSQDNTDMNQNSITNSSIECDDDILSMFRIKCGEKVMVDFERENVKVHTK